MNIAEYKETCSLCLMQLYFDNTFCLVHAVHHAAGANLYGVPNVIYLISSAKVTFLINFVLSINTNHAIVITYSDNTSLYILALPCML